MFIIKYLLRLSREKKQHSNEVAEFSQINSIIWCRQGWGKQRDRARPCSASHRRGRVPISGSSEPGKEAMAETWREWLWLRETTDKIYVFVRDMVKSTVTLQGGSWRSKYSESIFLLPSHLVLKIPNDQSQVERRGEHAFGCSSQRSASVLQSATGNGRAWLCSGKGQIPGTVTKHMGLKHFLFAIL